MSLCINPHCSKPDNSNNVLFCQACGSELLLEGCYRTIKLLGQGGFGRTYEVIDVHSNSQRVLKVLIRNEPKAVELFQREAEVLKVLNHPGIPKVEEGDYFIYFPRASQEPLHCLVMEKIEGMDLYEYMKQREYRPIKEKLAVQWLKKIVEILQLVHDKNFFHRDIKPPNIMLRANGQLVLIDFGAVREATKTYYFAQQQGQVTGVISVGYTPNEQMNGQAIPQSDFFALGRTFVFLLTGKEPTDPAIFDSYNDELHWKTIALDISPKFGDLIDRMMARLPSQRPADTREILQSFAQIEQFVNPPRGSSSSSSSPSIPATVQSIPSTPQSKSDLTPQPIVESDFRTFWFLANIVGFATFGILLPIMQWLVLRRRVSRLPKTGWWVLVTFVGFILGFFVGLFVAYAVVSVFITPGYSLRVHNIVGFIVWGTVGCTLLGTMQWLLLRKWISQSQNWIWTNGIGGLVAAIIGLAVGGDGSDSGLIFIYWIRTNGIQGLVAAIIGLAVGGDGSDSRLIFIAIVLGFLVYTAITGEILIRLLKNPISKS